MIVSQHYSGSVEVKTQHVQTELVKTEDQHVQAGKGYTVKRFIPMNSTCSFNLILQNLVDLASYKSAIMVMSSCALASYKQ